MWRWIKRAVWISVALFLGYMAVGIANMPKRTPLPRIAEVAPPKPLTTGTYAKVTGYTIACSSQADFEALSDIAVTMGTEADNEHSLRLLMSGRCRAFHVGQDVQIAGVAVIPALRAIRPKGEATSYWTTEKALRAD